MLPVRKYISRPKSSGTSIIDSLKRSLGGNGIALLSRARLQGRGARSGDGGASGDRHDSVTCFCPEAGLLPPGEKLE